MLTDHVQFCNSNRLSIAMYLICGIGLHLIYVACLLLGVAVCVCVCVCVCVYVCVCVFQCQPTALLRALGSTKGG